MILAAPAVTVFTKQSLTLLSADLMHTVVKPVKRPMLRPVLLA